MLAPFALVNLHVSVRTGFQETKDAGVLTSCPPVAFTTPCPSTRLSQKTLKGAAGRWWFSRLARRGPAAFAELRGGCRQLARRAHRRDSCPWWTATRHRSVPRLLPGPPLQPLSNPGTFLFPIFSKCPISRCPGNTYLDAVHSGRGGKAMQTGDRKPLQV